jgi:hypothetical protein
MTQMSFADAEYAGTRKQTRRERFLKEMDQVGMRPAKSPIRQASYPSTLCAWEIGTGSVLAPVSAKCCTMKSTKTLTLGDK